MIKISKLDNSGTCLIYGLSKADELGNKGALELHSNLETQNLILDDNSTVAFSGTDCVLSASKSATVGSVSLTTNSHSNAYLATPKNTKTDKAFFSYVTDCDYGGKVNIVSQTARQLSNVWNALTWERTNQADKKATILLEERANGKWKTLKLASGNAYLLETAPKDACNYRLFDGEHFVVFTEWKKIQAYCKVIHDIVALQPKRSDYAVISQIIN